VKTAPLALVIALVSALLAASGTMAQQAPGAKRIGVALFGIKPDSQAVQAFRTGLREHGYVEGRDVVLEIQTANGDPQRTGKVLEQLLGGRIDVLVVESTNTALAAKRATRSVPIVLAFVADPVGSGIVPSLSRPGGNITGMSNMTADLIAKRLQLLKEAVPHARRIGVMWNPDTPWHVVALQRLQAAAPALGVTLERVTARSPADLDPAFDALARASADALLLVDGPFTGLHGPAIMRRAMKAGIPVAYWGRALLPEGLLIGYGPDIVEIFRRASGYVDKILRGAKPGDLPIEQPTRVELLVNLKAAHALGLTIPPALLVRADEVIR
jgi:putative ABC transport system substrate-binding protein